MNPENNWLDEYLGYTYGVPSVLPPSMGALDYAVKTAPWSDPEHDVKAEIKKVLDEQYSSFFVGDKPSKGVGPTNHRTQHVHVDLITKEPTMDRTESIKSRLAALESELAEREAFGEDTYTDGSVLKFKADFNGDKSYSYAAIKADGSWYLTGRETGARSWSDLVDFWISCHVTKVWGMAKAVRLV